MGPCVDAGIWLFRSGASITNDALALSGVEWGTALASGWLGGMVVDSLGVAGWIGAVVVVLALGATVLFDAVAALWASGPVFLVGIHYGFSIFDSFSPHEPRVFSMVDEKTRKWQNG